ncbi:MAG: hypothetical protein MUF54_17025 [Polyangiaceae bacterium]|jgi:hypothetical protein|nr:hypothetical protein [Polyangiaceae bacterium]
MAIPALEERVVRNMQASLLPRLLALEAVDQRVPDLRPFEQTSWPCACACARGGSTCDGASRIRKARLVQGPLHVLLHLVVVCLSADCTSLSTN